MVDRRVRDPIRKAVAWTGPVGGRRASESEKKTGCQRCERTYGSVESSPPEEDVLQHISFIRSGRDWTEDLGSWRRLGAWIGSRREGRIGKWLYPIQVCRSHVCCCLGSSTQGHGTLTRPRSMFAQRAESFLRGVRQFSSTACSRKKHIDHYATLSIPRTASKAQIKVCTNQRRLTFRTNHIPRRRATIR